MQAAAEKLSSDAGLTVIQKDARGKVQAVLKKVFLENTPQTQRNTQLFSTLLIRHNWNVFLWETLHLQDVTFQYRV